MSESKASPHLFGELTEAHIRAKDAQRGGPRDEMIAELGLPEVLRREREAPSIGALSLKEISSPDEQLHVNTDPDDKYKHTFVVFGHNKR